MFVMSKTFFFAYDLTPYTVSHTDSFSDSLVTTNTLKAAMTVIVFDTTQTNLSQLEFYTFSYSYYHTKYHIPKLVCN